MDVTKKFQELVNPQKEMAANLAFIVDDTIDERVGYKIENITTVHDHVDGKREANMASRIPLNFAHFPFY